MNDLPTAHGHAEGDTQACQACQAGGRQRRGTEMAEKGKMPTASDAFIAGVNLASSYNCIHKSIEVQGQN